jgi:hypothetical protein
MEAATKISKKSLIGQAMCFRVGIPASSPDRVIYGAVRMKSNLQWNPQKVGGQKYRMPAKRSCRQNEKPA